MPREIYLLSAEPVTLQQLVRAGLVVDESLVVRGIASGNATQLLDDNDDAVLTIENSRKLADPADALTLLSTDPVRTGSLEPGECWWTQATAPWSAAGTVGREVMTGLATVMDARLWIEDGT